MNKRQTKLATALVADALAARELPFAGDRRSAMELLRTPGWAEGLSQLLPIRRRLTCGEVLEVCAPVLSRLSPAPEEGWLSFCYRYVRSILYPAGGFAPDGGGTLEVDCPPALLAGLPADKGRALLEVLSRDPRPPYQHDPDRVYGMDFAGHNVRFSVSGNTLTVLSIEALRS